MGQIIAMSEIFTKWVRVENNNQKYPDKQDTSKTAKEL